MSGRTGLSGQDLSFLAWESRERPMHIAVRAEFAGAPPTLAALRATFAERVADEPRLRSRLVGRRWEVDADFRIDRHVHAAVDRDPDAVLRAPLDPDYPLWEIWLVASPSSPHAFTLFVKIHHALIDGIAGVALIERLLGGARRELREAASTVSGRGGAPTLGATLRFVGDHFHSGDETPLNGDVGTARRHHELDVDAEAFAACAKRLHGTHNDLVLAAVSGAIRRWLRDEMRPPLPHRLRAFCPVSLRVRGQREAFGNRISPWFVSLPIAEPHACVRVRSIQQQTSRLKRRRAERGGEGMARVVRRLGGWVARLGMAIAAWRRAFSVVVTNVPGPAPIELLGARLVRLFAYAPLFPGQRLSVAVVRYDGRLFFGVTEGWEDAGRGRRFAEALEQELSDLAPDRLRRVA